LKRLQATLTLAELAKKPRYVILNAIPPRSGIGPPKGARLAIEQVGRNDLEVVLGRGV